jgi:hypothetical protein
MTRNTVNYWINLTAGLCMVGMLYTGLILAFVLPPGSGQATLWGVRRHDWGDVHFWLSVGLVALMVVHLALHWAWVCATTSKLLGIGHVDGRAARRRLVSGVVVLVLLASSSAALVFGGRTMVESPRKVSHAVHTNAPGR